MKKELARRSSRILLLAVLADLITAAIKFLGSNLSGSASLAAEAIHSSVDGINELLLWIGERRSQKPPSARHPIGHGREIFFWSFVVALLIFSLGGVYNIHEGIDKLHTKHLSNPILSLLIIAVSLVVELVSYRAVLKEIRERARRPKINLVRWFRRSTSSDLLVIFTEDLAAILGLIVAAAGVVGTMATGEPRWDAWGSIAIGIILVFMAVALAIEIKSLIIGESPAQDYSPEIKKLLGEIIPGAKLVSFIAVQIGLGEVIANYKISAGGIEKSSDLIERMHKLERSVRQKFPEIRWQFIEPVTGH
jgi:cation diffusion facilitator family transporter